MTVPNCQPPGCFDILTPSGRFGSAICLSLRFRSHGCSFQGAEILGCNGGGVHGRG